jgi:hypothetical protein
MVDPVISMGACLVLAFVLAAAALHKARDMVRFGAAIEAYGLLPAPLVPAVARALPVLELALACGLLVPALRAQAGAGAAALLGVYTLAIAVNLARGRSAIDCGCGDPDQRQPLSGWLLLRNGMLVGGAFLAGAPQAARTLGWLDWAVALPAAAALLLLYTAGNGLLANRELLANLRPSHDHA